MMQLLKIQIIKNSGEIVSVCGEGNGQKACPYFSLPTHPLYICRRREIKEYISLVKWTATPHRLTKSQLTQPFVRRWGLLSVLRVIYIFFETIHLTHM